MVIFPRHHPVLSWGRLTWRHLWSQRTGVGGSPPAGSQSAGHLGSGLLGAAHLKADTHIWGFHRAQAPSLPKKPGTRTGTDFPGSG